MSPVALKEPQSVERRWAFLSNQRISVTASMYPGAGGIEWMAAPATVSIWHYYRAVESLLHDSSSVVCCGQAVPFAMASFLE